MTVVAALAGFIFALLLDKSSNRPLSVMLDMLILRNSVAHVLYGIVFVAIVFCAIVFQLDLSKGDWGPFYKFGQFMASPAVGMFIIFFIIGVWLYVDGPKIRAFLRDILESNK